MSFETGLNKIDFASRLTPQRLISTVFDYESRHNIIMSNQAILNICYLLNGYSLYLYGVPLVHDYFEKTKYGPVHPIIEKQIAAGVSYTNAESYAQDQYLEVIFALLDNLFEYSNVELARLVKDDYPIGHRYTNDEMLKCFVDDFGLDMPKRTGKSIELTKNDDGSGDSDGSSDSNSGSNDDGSSGDSGSSDSDGSGDSGDGGRSLDDDTDSDDGSGDDSDSDGSDDSNGSNDSDSSSDTTGSTSDTSGSTGDASGSNDANGNGIPDDLEDDLF